MSVTNLENTTDAFCFYHVFTDDKLNTVDMDDDLWRA